MNNYPSYLLNINLYALLSVYSVFAMLTSGLYSGDYLGMQVFSNGDSQYIMLLSLILILSQVSILYSLMLVRAGVEPHDDSSIKYISLIVFTGITISYIGAIYFNYGVAGKFSENKFGFIFKVIPIDILIYFYIYKKFKKTNKLPWIMIIYYISLKVMTGWTGMIFYLAVFIATLKPHMIFNKKSLLLIFVMALLIPVVYAGKLYFRGYYPALKSYMDMSIIDMYLYAISTYIDRLAYFQNNLVLLSKIDMIKDLSLNYIDEFWYIKEFFGGFMPKGLLSLKVYNVENFMPMIAGKELDYGVSYITGILSKAIFVFNYGALNFAIFISFILVVMLSINKALKYIFGKDSKLFFIFFMCPFLVTGHIGNLSIIFYGTFFYLMAQKIHMFLSRQ
ncbi:TPA: oligosaccharide repeat unit polymerase [Morganella morganii]